MASQKFHAKVVVIGGGVAGLTAAAKLRKYGGFEVILLEADNRIGGRVETKKFGQHFIENGAQWVHGAENNSIYSMAQPLDLLASRDFLKFNADSIFVFQDGQVISKTDHEKASLLVEKVLEGPEEHNSESDEPLGDWSNRTFWNENNKILLNKNTAAATLDWLHRFQTSIDGSDNWFTPSCKGQQEYWECLGNPTISWKSPACYATLLNLILYEEPSVSPIFSPDIPDWIHLNKEVVEVDYKDENSVTVRCKDNSIFKCDHVICTVSLGVLKEKAEELFQPGLSKEKILAITHLSIGCVNKLHFDFPTIWWPENIIGFNLLWNDSADVQDHYNSSVSEDILKTEIDGLPIWCRGIIGFYVVASHPTALNSWMTGPSAKLVETLDEAVVKTTFMRVLRHFVGSKYDIPDPVNFVRSKWYSNPFTRGSYSFRSVDSEKHNVWSTEIAFPIMKQNSPVICFAGEASHIHFYSTVHGAHDSGLREATRLINYYSENDIKIHSLFPYTEEMFQNQDK